MKQNQLITSDQKLLNDLAKEIKLSIPMAKHIFVKYSKKGRGAIVTKLSVKIKKKLFRVEAVAYDLIDSLWNAKNSLDQEISNHIRRTSLYLH